MATESFITVPIHLDTSQKEVYSPNTDSIVNFHSVFVCNKSSTDQIVFDLILNIGGNDYYFFKSSPLCSSSTVTVDSPITLESGMVLKASCNIPNVTDMIFCGILTQWT